MREVFIFGRDGTKLYTIERGLVFNPLWTMYSHPDRRPVATIVVGLTFASFDFLNRADFCHRDVLVDIGFSGAYKSFYLPDGAKYSWTTGLRFLEKIQSPYCGVEEVRVRVAKAKLMRQFRLDFEILVDESLIDREVALASSFISMLTQWGVGNAIAGVGPTFIAPEFEAPLDSYSSPQVSVPASLKTSSSYGAAFDQKCEENLTRCVDELASADSDAILVSLKMQKSSPEPFA